MVGFVEDAARRQGVERLWLKVWDRNPRARRLYERLGFGLDRIEGDVVILSKTLS